MYKNLTYSSFDSFIVQSNYTRILIHITRILNTYTYTYKGEISMKKLGTLFYLFIINIHAGGRNPTKQ